VVKRGALRLRKKRPLAHKIVIDAALGWVFESEKELFSFFAPQIEKLEKEFQKHKAKITTPEVSAENIEAELEITLDQPSEIWHDSTTFSEFPVFIFVRPIDRLLAFQVAVTYVSSEDEPTFIFLHFLTPSLEFLEHYRRGDLVYDRTVDEVSFACLEGDSLSEGDPLGLGLFLSMLKLRTANDIRHDQFIPLGQELREATIENADEIWRSSSVQNNQLVTFIRHFPDHEMGNLYYLAVTQEDPGSSVHTLLFSFPTNDEQLVDRYRHGENLQADEVVQESSH
jgi:hypothetical protein